MSAFALLCSALLYLAFQWPFPVKSVRPASLSSSRRSKKKRRDTRGMRLDAWQEKEEKIKKDLSAFPNAAASKQRLKRAKLGILDRLLF
ncbi:hypothetical protein BD289DRAFT_443189 [Coniella lustricola]|uniref:Uncharacterized protein n=1 Tax=Coniella lustricola TaxID=2025994 RepID=A0A2T2ZXD0_9PEZI|nr:hypothetical protein BD289DRAFT_443189 [Coniella lustricola]